MEITKDKLKRSLIGAGATFSISEYIAASGVRDYPKFVEYDFSGFREALTYNLAHPIATISNALSTELFWQIQPFLFGASLYVAGKVLLAKPNKYEDASDYGAYGTSRWAKPSEIFNPDNITSDMKKPGNILAKYKSKMIIQHEQSELNRNILAVGGSGGGKTTSLIIPNIIHEDKKSIVVIDPKGELYEKTAKLKKEQGYEVHLMNFKDRDHSDRYNLFEYLRGDSDAFKIADRMVNNAGEGDKIKKDFWNQGQIAVLQALMLYVKYALPKKQKHMGSVYNMASASLIQIYQAFMEFPQEHIVRRAFASAIERLLGNPKTLSDVFQTLLNTLNPWQYQQVCQFTAANDFQFEDLGKKKMIVYVMIPIADNEFLPLITTFFDQMLSELYHLADQNNSKLPQNVIMLWDEFANIGKIPHFHKRLSTTRSLGIEMTIILQDTSQLQNIYGKDIAKEILNNCDIKILLKANEYETAKYFSQLAGKTTIKIKNSSSSSGSKSSSKSESYTYAGRDLITPDEITAMNSKEGLLFISGNYPVKYQKPFYFKEKSFKNILGEEVSRADYPVPDRGEYSEFIPPEPELPPTTKQKKQKKQKKQENEYDQTLFIPYENKKVDTETGEILEELSQPHDEEYEQSLDDLLKNFNL